jgi:cytochrome c oxidase cbb3-type subunit 3
VSAHEEPGARPPEARGAARQSDGPPEMVVHEYDGIVEHDNVLLCWWVGAMIATIVFAFSYWLFFHSFDKGQLASAAYAERKAVELAAEAERIKAAGEVTPEMLTTLMKDPSTVDQGKQVFESTCTTCHDAGGKGKIGPNLTDAYWLHGGDPRAIYGTIRDGYLPRQMPAWGKPLGEARVRAVTAYVMSLKDTNAPGGKEPQGEKQP